jgi:hypothetical protein
MTIGLSTGYMVMPATVRPPFRAIWTARIGLSRAEAPVADAGGKRNTVPAVGESVEQRKSGVRLERPNGSNKDDRHGHSTMVMTHQEIDLTVFTRRYARLRRDPAQRGHQSSSA